MKATMAGWCWNSLCRVGKIAVEVPKKDSPEALEQESNIADTPTAMEKLNAEEEHIPISPPGAGETKP